MSAPDLIAALTPVVEAFERLGVAYHVGGSIASSAYGIARATLDVDVVADFSETNTVEFVRALSPAYYVDETEIREAITRKTSFSLVHLETMVKIDVFVSPRLPFDIEAQGRARELRLDGNPDSRTYRVKSAEDIVLAKLQWFAAAGGVSEKQWGDVVGVLRVQGPQLDLTFLRKAAATLSLSEILERALRQAGIP